VSAVARVALRLALAAAAVGAGAPLVGAGPDGAAAVEKEVAAAIRKVAPATVVCLAKSAPKGFPGSSGVIVSKDGWVLSDADAGLVLGPPPSPTTPSTGPARAAPKKTRVDDVDVRVPDPVVPGKPPSSKVYAAKVVSRIDEIDSALLKITTPPASGFPFVALGSSDELRVGALAFAVGNSFGSSEEGTPTLTAGIVSSLVRAPEGDRAGRHREIYTSAAVNPGVNGGPLVDAEGALIGVVSTWVTPRDEPWSPFQFLGRVIPVDRIRAAHRAVPAATAAFAPHKAAPARSKQSAHLERAYEAAATRAARCLASLVVTRKPGVERKMPLDRGRELKLYQGPVTGIVAGNDGTIVTALYNLANTLDLADRAAGGDIEKDLANVDRIVAHFADGQSATARIVSHDQRLGIVCLKADLLAYTGGTPEPAPAESFEVGRTVLCVADPFGERRGGGPFVTAGIVSRSHPADTFEPWRGDFQTDAGMTDGNAGGALVDLRGRVLGLATPWHAPMHGRNSGIGFGVPWSRIAAALPSLCAGASFRYGNAFLGVEWRADGARVRIVAVTPESAASKAGLQKDDRIVAVDGKEITALVDAMDAVRSHRAGETLKLEIEREGKRIALDVVLGARPGT
jgi:S1-C subfamily serine protease